MNKQALKTEYAQAPEGYQGTRKPTAVIVKGNPAYITGNKHAAKFYNDLASHVRSQGYSVTFDPGEPYTEPPKADLWIGHSRGADRLRFAPKETKTVALGTTGGINHPLDKAMLPGQVPTVFHFLLTDEQKGAVSKAMEKKAFELSPQQALGILGGIGGAGLGGVTGLLAGGKGNRVKGGLIGAGIGGLTGGAAGYLGGMGVNQLSGKDVPIQPLIEPDKAKAVMSDVISKKEVTPRALDQAVFPDLDKRIAAATEYRAAHPELKFKQDLGSFDKKVPVYTLDTAPAQLKPFISARFDSNPNMHGFLETKGPQTGISGWLNKKLSNTPTSYAALRNGPDQTPQNLFNYLTHEVKGHGTQKIDNDPGHSSAQALMPQVASQDSLFQKRFKYLTDPQELERRIQAMHDWSAKNLGYRAKSPEQFGDIMKKAPHYDGLGFLNGQDLSDAGYGDAADLPSLLNDLRAKGIDPRQLEDYIKRMAPGVVQNQQQSNIPKTAAFKYKGPLFGIKPKFEEGTKHNRYAIDYNDKNIANVYHKIKSKEHPSGIYIEPNYENSKEGLKLLANILARNPMLLADLKIKPFDKKPFHQTGLHKAIKPLLSKK